MEMRVILVKVDTTEGKAQNYLALRNFIVLRELGIDFLSCHISGGTLCGSLIADTEYEVRRENDTIVRESRMEDCAARRRELSAHVTLTSSLST